MSLARLREKLDAGKLVPVLRAVAVVFGLFCLVMTVLLIATAVRLQAADPLNTPALAALKQRLASNPTDESLAAQIRALDLLARQAYFTSRNQIDSGAVLLAIAFGIAVAGLKLAAELQKRVPDPKEFAKAPLSKGFTGARRALLIGMAVLVAATCIASFLSTRDLATDYRDIAKFLGLGDYPSHADVMKNWPFFRGPLAGEVPDGTPGSSDFGKAALRALWRTDLGLEGRSSPAVWADRVYLTGATADVQEIYCLDSATGALVWKKSVKDILGRTPAAPEVSKDTGWAAPSPATDGRRIFVMFASGQLLCLDRGGALLWYKDFGIPENTYGIASSPVIWEDELILQWDQSNMSVVMAFQTSSGRMIWQHERKLQPSWATPIVVEDGRFQALVVVGNPVVEALDLRTGETLWASDCMSGDAAPSPSYAGGTVFTASNLTPVLALPAASSNGNMAVEPLWSREEDLPDTPSLLTSGERLYLVSGTGMISCLDAKTGGLLWKNRLEAEVSSSPILVSGTVFIGDKAGVLHRFLDRPVYEPLEDVGLGAPIWATPAFRDGRLYVRAGPTLVCLGRSE